MTTPFSEVKQKMVPASRKRARTKANKMLHEMALNELRRALELSQEELARTLKQKQSSISKLEKRTDMFISTLRSYIQAMGGELEIRARFPDGEIKITQFKEIHKPKVA